MQIKQQLKPIYFKQIKLYKILLPWKKLMIKVEADPFIYGSVSGKSSKEMNYNINLNLPDSIKELMFQQQLVQ